MNCFSNNVTRHSAGKKLRDKSTVLLRDTKLPGGVTKYLKIMMTWPGDYKKSCSTQLIVNFFLLINITMPKIVGILTFMSRKTSTLGSSEP